MELLGAWFMKNNFAGLQRYLRRPKLPQFAAVAFFSKSSPFSRLRKALDCRIKEMTAAGVVRVSVKRADPV